MSIFIIIYLKIDKKKARKSYILRRKEYYIHFVLFFLH